MTVSRQDRSLIRKLLDLCMAEGQLSEQHVQAVLQWMERFPIGRQRLLMRLFLRSIRRLAAQQTILVESPQPLTEAVQLQIRKSLSARYQRSLSIEVRENMSLIGGLRIRVGDDLMDASVSGALSRLAVLS